MSDLAAQAPTITPRGQVRKLWHLPADAHEVMLAGPAETGKTFGALAFLHEQLLANRNAQATMVRKVRASIYGSAVQTFRKVIRPEDGVTPFGGEFAEWFDYPNGARLWVAGMDNPGKSLSSERDYIYINQAEELARTDYETLLTRATGRAGNVAQPLVLGDCNPGPPAHWILRRADAGHLLKLDTRHEDNPALYDERGGLTEQGERTMRVLNALTGVEYQRLRLGLWVAAEGNVYQLQEAHLGRELFQPDKPTQLAVDPSNGSGPYAALVLQQVGSRVLVVGEFYQVGGMDEDLRDWLLASPYYARLTNVVCDPAKPDTIRRLGAMLRDPRGRGVAVQAKQGRKDITAQIAAVKSLMVVDPVSKAAPLVIDREQCPMLLDEFSQYVWKKPSPSAPDRNVNEEPEDAHNHCLDALAYWVTTKAITGLRQGGTFTRPATREPSPWEIGTRR